MSRLNMGVAKVDITPTVPVPLAGYGNRKGIYEGISNRLYLRANVFRQIVADEERLVLLAQADIIWWGPERMAGIYKKLKERFGIPEEHVILNASHTHGGPQTTTAFIDTLGLPDNEYMEKLEQLLLQAVDEAMQSIEPVQVERGTGTCQIGINRRKWVDNVIVMAPNHEGEIDTDVTIVRFVTDSGRTKAVLTHYTCHPTTTNANLITSDYAGVAMEQVEQSIGEGAVASFLQGCCGDTRPALHKDGAFYSGTNDDVLRSGRVLAEEVLAVLGRPLALVEAGEIGGSTTEAMLPFDTLPAMDEITTAAEASTGVTGEWANKLKQNPHLLQPAIPLHLTRINIAEGLSFLAMDGEMVLEYGTFVKRLSGGKVLPLGYSNGMVGYVPSARQVEEGGYEGRGSYPLFMLPAIFDPALQSEIEKGISQLIR
ncbi:MAG: hypothetical protein K0R67_3928 [Paenibacillus sp.]|jgi:hypothetical protein|nr:hypothetical protein [Paenibacillus sp.]